MRIFSYFCGWLSERIMTDSWLMKINFISKNIRHRVERIFLLFTCVVLHPLREHEEIFLYKMLIKGKIPFVIRDEKFPCNDFEHKKSFQKFFFKKKIKSDKFQQQKKIEFSAKTDQNASKTSKQTEKQLTKIIRVSLDWVHCSSAFHHMHEKKWDTFLNWIEWILLNDDVMKGKKVMIIIIKWTTDSIRAWMCITKGTSTHATQKKHAYVSIFVT